MRTSRLLTAAMLISAALAAASSFADDFLSLPSHDLTENGQQTNSPLAIGDAVTLTVDAIALPPGSLLPLSLLPPEPAVAASPGPSPSVPPSSTPEQRLREALEGNFGVEVLSVSSAQGVDGAKLTVEFSPLQAGRLTLPSLAIADSSGKPIARTNPWTIEAVSTLSKEEKEAKKPEGLRGAWGLAFPPWVLPVLIVLGLIVACALAYGIYRLALRLKPVPPPPPPKTEDEVALAALEKLRSSDFAAKGQFKKQYFGVSEILKSYIGARYSFDAPECTTKELLQAIEPRLADSLKKDSYENLAQLFPKLDLVKFTDHVPDPNEAAQIVKSAQDFVMATRKPKSVLSESGKPDASR